MTKTGHEKLTPVTRSPSRRSRLLIAACTVSVSLCGCAGGESLTLPFVGPIETGSLPDPSGVAKGATDQVSEMALVTGLTKAPARERLKELFAIDQKCYSIVSQDEVWQDVKAEQANRKPGQVAKPMPPISNPWTPENKAYYKQHCTQDAQQARSLEMRSLHL